MFNNFQQDHGKTYKSLREEKLRFEIFQSTLETIKKHNAKFEIGEESWSMGVNQFSDLTDEEFKEQYLSEKPIETESLGMISFNGSAPDSIDWRTKGAVLSVKNQIHCLSCWAFSAVSKIICSKFTSLLLPSKTFDSFIAQAAAIEGQNAIKHGIKIDLSPQELVDCSFKYGNDGCGGGFMFYAFDYVKDHGISKLVDYPYRGDEGSCKLQSNSANITLTGFRDIVHTEEDLKQAVGMYIYR